MLITSPANHSHAVNQILEVYNYGSSIGSFYDILAPIQITLEYCQGLEPTDYYNIMMVSPSDSYYHTATIDSFFNKFNARTPHQHNYFEFLIMLEGEMIQKIENKEYLYTAGSCCLINRNIVHIEKFLGTAKVLFVGLSIDFVKEIITSNKFSYFKNEENVLSNPVFQFMDKNIKDSTAKTYLDFFPTFQNNNCIRELHRISDQLVNAIFLPKFGATYIVKGLICELFQYLDTDFHITPIQIASNPDALLFSRISHLLEDTDGHVSRSTLEKEMNYSGNYLNSIVNKYTGMCLFDFGMTFCLKKAEFLLANTDESISTISLKLGFSNRTHFYKLFSNKHGMTPKEYRLEKRTQTNER